MPLLKMKEDTMETYEAVGFFLMVLGAVAVASWWVRYLSHQRQQHPK